MSFTALEPLGWTSAFLPFVDPDSKEELARVVLEERGQYLCALSLDKQIWAEVSGKLKFAAQGREAFPAVGDFVYIRPKAERSQITQVLERRSCLKRRAAGKGQEVQIFAANIDYVLIVTSVNADFSVRRVERYLAMTWDSGAQPLILLNKADLVPDASSFVQELKKVSADSPVICLSALQQSGLEPLAQYLTPGKTAVVVGSSGVGKSTLLNSLLGEQKVKTQAAREEDAKGRHTTTTRSLHRLPSGALLIDTPGIRELHLLDFEAGLAQTFADVEEIFPQCRFTNCGHGAADAHCEIQRRLASGELERERWDSYQKLQNEMRSLEVKKNPTKMKEDRGKWKQIHKDLRQKYKAKKRP